MRARLLFAFAPVTFGVALAGCATAGDAGAPTVGRHDSSVDIGFDVGPIDDAPIDTTVTPGDSGTKKDSGTTTTDSGTVTTDSGAVTTDSGSVTTDSGTVTTDTGSPFEGGTSQGGTTGKPCTSDGTCDVLGDGVQKCSSTIGFTLGKLYPDPVCIGKTCTPDPTGASIVFCDGLAGVCLASGTSGICLPTCNFDSTTSPTGCVGKDACNAYGWTTASPAKGVGYCFGGCKVDGDCSGGKCQTETGLCVTTKLSYSKSIGAACTSADATAPAKCNCLYNTTASAGYCTETCTFGSSSCPSGYTCDTLLPTTYFTGSPSGLQGFCLKTCTGASDCTGLSSTCKQSAGVSSKTCQPF